MENLKDLLGDSYNDFRMLYDMHMNEMNSMINKIKEKAALRVDK